MRSTTEKKIFSSFGTAKNSLNGKWFVKYYVPDYSTGNLKPVKYYGEINKFNTIKERLAECERIKILIETGQPLPNLRGARRKQDQRPEYNFASPVKLMYEALEDRRNTIDPDTYSTYKSKIYTFELWLKSQHLENLPIGAFDIAHAVNFLGSLKKGKLANNTYNNYKIVLGSLWEDVAKALRRQIKIENIWRDIDCLKKQTKPFRIYPTEIEQRIAQILPGFDAQLWLFIQVTHYSFMRGSENRKIKVGNFNLAERTITIYAHQSKNRKEQTISIPNPLYDLLCSIDLQQYPDEYYLFSTGGTPGKKPVSKNYFRYRWRRFRELHEIPEDFKIYGFKHTGVVKLIRAKIPLKQIQKQLRHHSLDQLDQYAQAIDVSDLEDLSELFPEMGSERQKRHSNRDLLQMILSRLEDGK